MLKTLSMFAMAGMMTLAISGASQAQDQTMRKMTSGQSPALMNSMTQAQASKACRAEMRGARESKKSIRVKMRQCVNQKMQGNN